MQGEPKHPLAKHPAPVRTIEVTDKLVTWALFQWKRRGLIMEKDGARAYLESRDDKFLRAAIGKMSTGWRAPKC